MQPWLRNACSQYSDSHQLQRYIAVGDAVCAFDPISSMGLGFAISSACHAARLVVSELQPEPATVHPAGPTALTGHQLYQQDILAHFSAYQQLRRHFYQSEQRWQQARFWQRRQQTAT